MRQKKTIKCGEFLCKDGVVVRRPGKKFRAPLLPEKMKIPYPEADISLFSAVFSLCMSDEYDDIDQTNAMKEKSFQEKYIKQHRQLRNMYYFSQIVSGVKRICRRLTRRFPSSQMMGSYFDSQRQHS